MINRLLCIDTLKVPNYHNLYLCCYKRASKHCHTFGKNTSKHMCTEEVESIHVRFQEPLKLLMCKIGLLKRVVHQTQYKAVKHQYFVIENLCDKSSEVLINFILKLEGFYKTKHIAMMLIWSTIRISSDLHHFSVTYYDHCDSHEYPTKECLKCFHLLWHAKKLPCIGLIII